jgi:hypothetical protein
VAQTALVSQPFQIPPLGDNDDGDCDVFDGSVAKAVRISAIIWSSVKCLMLMARLRQAAAQTPQPLQSASITVDFPSSIL